METSCGVLIIKEGTLFIGHVSSTNHWDIPKGRLEVGETKIEAASREALEETGFSIQIADLKDLGEFKYKVEKDLHLFLYTGEIFPNPNTAKASTYFSINGNYVPEMDEYKYVDFHNLHKYVTPKLLSVLQSVLDF